VTFLRGLLAGRSHLAVLAGLAAAAATVGAIHDLAPDAPPLTRFEAIAPPARELPLRPHGPLDGRERAMAQSAWSWFERNTDPVTGLAPAVTGHRAATLWETGALLLAIVSAEDLGLVAASDATDRLARVLRSLAALPLCEGGLPNKAYDTRTLELVRYDGTPAPGGVGWSALDIARALLGMSLATRRHPELAPLVAGAVSRWRLDALADGAALRGATRHPDGRLEPHPEGRFGYEQHAAKSLVAWGVAAPVALDYRAHVAFRRVEGQPLPHDARRPSDHGGAHAALVPEPWLLDALEHGPDAVTLPVSRALLRAQARRHAASGRLTAVSEDALDRAPWFSYSALVNADDTWIALGPDGAPAPGALTFSTKAAVAWGVLFEGRYPEQLLAAAAELAVPGEGLHAGRYDASGEVNHALSLNTNAVVLEALAYRVRGPSMRGGAAGQWVAKEGAR
jgi:Protein of unknown function (DUF3131)